MRPFLALLLPPCLALNNGLARLPGLGWNSDYCANCSHPNGFGGEHFVAAISHYMHSVKQGGAAGGATLQELGFHYVNMDASWDTSTRSASGQLVPDPRLWPSGIEKTIAHVHSLGLGFGLYGDRGKKDCAKNPGNLGHEVSDARQYAAWGIDWYKTDSCDAASDAKTAIAEYSRMRDALNSTGRPIWLALCGWHTFYAPPDPSIGYLGGKSLGNSWRVGEDTGKGWTAVVSNIQAALSVAQWAGPTASGGGWNDGSLQLTPGMGGRPPSAARLGEAGHVSPPLPSSSDYMDVARFRSMYGSWCVLALNLLLTGNFSGLSPIVLETWSNPEVLSINQDPLGAPPRLLNATSVSAASSSVAAATVAGHPLDSERYQRAVMAECGGEPSRQKWAYNQSGLGEIRNGAICLNVKNCESALIYDGCSPAQPFGCGSNEAFEYDEKRHRLVSRLPGARCLTEDSSTRELSLAACDGGGQQHFEFTTNGQLVDASSYCLTAAGPPSPSTPKHFFIGRQLGGGAAPVYGPSPPGFAVLLLNNDLVDTNVTCGKACLVELGLDPATTYSVRDVWTHEVLDSVNVQRGEVLTLRARAGGDSQVVRLAAA